MHGSTTKRSAGEIRAAIGAVIVLSTILLPILGIRQATGVSVRDKMLKLNASIGMYVVDNDRTYPIGCGASGWQPVDGGWMLLVKPYTSDWQKTVVSNYDPKNKTSWPDWLREFPEAFNTSFAANGYLRFDGISWGLYGVMGLAQSGNGGWMSRGVTRYEEIADPANTISFAEAYNGNPLYLTSNILSGVDWWDSICGVGGLIPDPTRDGSPYIVNGLEQTENNRRGGVNGHMDGGQVLFAWADGHVERMAPQRTNPQPGDRSKNLWDALRPGRP